MYSQNSKTALKFLIALFIVSAGFFVFPKIAMAAITYDAGTDTITVTEGTASSPVTFTDIYNADVNGGWGQVTKTGNRFVFDAHLQIGDGSTSTYVADQFKKVTLNLSWTIKNAATLKLGLLDANNHPRKGCFLVLNTADANAITVESGGTFLKYQSPTEVTGTGTNNISGTVTDEFYRGIQILDLYGGENNNFGVGLVEDRDITRVLESIDPYYDLVARYNPVTEGWEYYDKTGPQNFTTIEPGVGHYLTPSDDCTLIIDILVDGDYYNEVWTGISTKYYFEIPAGGISVPKIKVLGTEYESSDNTAALYAQVLNTDGSPATSATVTLTVYDRDGNVVTGFDGVSMTHIAQGIYRYPFTAPVAEGAYAASVVASNPTAYGTGDFHIALWANKIAASSTIADAVWDEQRSGHTASGSFGEALQNIVPTAASIASEVWGYTTGAGRTLTAFGSLAADIWNTTYSGVRKLTSRQIDDEASEHIAREENIASNVWGATRTDYATSTTFGFALQNAVPTLTEIASSTWSYADSALDTTGNAISKVWSFATRKLSSRQIADEAGEHIAQEENISSNVWGYTGSALDTAGNAIAKVWSYATRKLTSRQIGANEYIAGVSSSSTVAQVANEADQSTTKYNVELVRKATFDFAGIADGGSTTTLVDSELDQPDDHWVNYELWMMSGNNIGLKRAICDFDKTTHTITLCDDPLSQPIASGDQYVISHERKLVHAIWNWTDRQLTSVSNIASAIWGWTGGSRRLTDKTLTGGGSLATESYIDQATSTIIAEIDANEALLNSLNSDLNDLSATTTLVLNKWDTYTAADIIGYVDEIESRLGTSTDATTTATLFGRANLIKEKWGTQTAQTIYDKADDAYGKIVEVQNELGYHGTSTSAYDDLQLVKGYTDDLEGYVGTPSDTSSDDTLFGKIKDVREKLDQLDTLESKLDTIDSIVDAIRASQQLDYTVELSDVGEVETTKTYRAKLSIWDYENNPANASTTPTIVLYNPVRTEIASSSMTLLSTGVYEYTYTVPSDAVCGLWETVVSVDLGGSSPLTLNDYWEVEGSPAQVIINSMSDLTVPSISANVTISNEGNSGYEYQYEWCVVASQDNQCGGGNDIDYASAAKYLGVGEDYTANLSATVPNTGDYWFKVIVYYGTEASGASRTFTATEEEEEEEETPSGGGGGGTKPVNLSKIYSKLLEVQNELGYHGTKRTAYKDLSNTRYSLGTLPDQLSEPLYQVLTGISSDIQALGGTKPYNLSDIYEVSKASADDLKYIINKIAELRAVIGVNKTLISKVANKPIIQTWFTEGSIILNIMVVNPPDTARTVEVKEYLPKEIRAENIIKMPDDLNLEYDSAVDTYYVSGKVKMKAGEKKIFKVEAEDIFTISDDELNNLRQQAATLMEPLKGTSYFAQASILKSEIDANLDSIRRAQIESSTNIERKISAFRNNQKDLQKVKANIGALKKIVSEASGKGGVFGSLFGVSTTMTWAIIIIVVVGIAVLMVLLFTLLMRSRALEYHISGGRLKAPPLVDLKKQAVKIKGELITYFLPPFGKPIVDLRQLIKLIKILIIVGILVVLVLLGFHFIKF